MNFKKPSIMLLYRDILEPVKWPLYMRDSLFQRFWRKIPQIQYPFCQYFNLSQRWFK